MQNLNKIKHITIVNVHWNNRGDEAALFGFLHGLRNEYKNAKITILFKDPKSVELFPDTEGVTYYHAQFKTNTWDIWLTTLTRGWIGFNKILKKSVRTLKRSDLIIYGPGGSVINNRFFWRKQMEYLMPFICSKLYRIPMMVAAPSIGPFDTNKSNIILRWLLKTPKVFCVREEISKQYLDQINIRDNVHVTIDSAFMNAVNMEENEAVLNQYNELKEFLVKYDKVVGLTITDFKWHVKYNKDKDLLNRIEDTFYSFIEQLTQNGYGVLFIPQLFGNQNDYNYMDKYSCIHTFIMDDKLDANFQQYVISKLYAVVGMRYHSNIFSAKMGTPFIAVVYEEKMQGFLKLAELMDYSLPLSEISVSKILEKFSMLEINYQQIKIQLKGKNEYWKKRAAKTLELLRGNI